DGLTFSEASRLKQEQGYQVFRSFDEAGGIRDELNQLAADHPELVKWEVVGTSVQDRPIIALKVTKDAATEEDGSRPAVLFSSLQHAREWIAVEVNRRFLHKLVDGYGNDDTITALLDSTEVWFVVVANPDGYQYTFGDERLWRKNLRDLDGDGQIVGREGVDLNRNFDAHWGYDNDGSDIEPLSDTYRGPEAASEPETQAMQGLLNRVHFVFQVNYHSAASLILYGTGWQDITWAPDDPIQAALAGDRGRPATEGFVPMLSSGLYITNGETCDYAHEVAGTLCWTPELTPGGIQGRSGFEFPDDEAAIQQEFEKNLPFAMDVALSATHPEAPESHLGNTVVPLTADPFAVSYGSPQLVAADAQRLLGDVTLHWRINGGDEVTAPAAEWDGGERFGAAGDVVYRRVRGEVTGARPGDQVEVWFTAGDQSTTPFTYERVPTSGADVLVVAAEDYTGAAPEYSGATGPLYLGTYLGALTALGYPADVYDVDARGRVAPHPLGVLSHYDLVIWYTGDDVVPQAPGMADGTVSRQARDMMMAMRAFMNEGGKLIHAGRWAGSPYFRGLEYDPVADAPCDPSTGADGCVGLQNDFYQYYLGVDGYGDNGGTSSSGQLHPVQGLAGPFQGAHLSFAAPGPGVADHSAILAVTGDRMPVADFPQFASQRAAIYDRPGDKPHTG
ncbi:MAG: M14 family metallopeptidase, partial [Anaerolineae bacterium]